jgi:hypothetical protein
MVIITVVTIVAAIMLVWALVKMVDTIYNFIVLLQNESDDSQRHYGIYKGIRKSEMQRFMLCGLTTIYRMRNTLVA